MDAFRFSLRWLLAFIAFVAVALVSLRYASTPLSAGLSIARIALLMVAIIGVVYRQERQRAFWFGCCVFGWSFAAYVHFGAGNKIIDRAARSVHDSVQWSVPATREAFNEHKGSGGTGQRSGIIFLTVFPRLFPFISASHSIIGITVALLGGVIAQWFHATQSNRQ